MWSPLNLAVDSWLHDSMTRVTTSSALPSIPKRWFIGTVLAFTPGNLEGSRGNLEFYRYDILIYMMILWWCMIPFTTDRTSTSFHWIYCSVLFSSHSVTLEITWDRYTNMDTNKTALGDPLKGDMMLRKKTLRSASTCLLHRTCTNSLGKGSREQL